jgi:hypothetical protein
MPTFTSGPPLCDALEKLGARLDGRAPFLAQALHAWMCRISPTGEPTGHFEHPRMFPILQLPEWMAEGLGMSRDREFHKAVTYSSICGYYYTRLVDNFMDGNVGTKDDIGLLPAAGFLASEFQFPYQRYFSPEHQFWNYFRTIWLEAAESAGHDAALQVVEEEDFEHISSRKFAAAGIPVAAVGCFYERLQAIDDWIQFAHSLGRWSQMFDDLLDWHSDRQQGRATWFLSEGQRRKRADESVQQWVIREGSAWGFELLEQWMRDLQRQARELGSPGAQAFLQQREALRREKEKEWKEGYASLARLADILQLT